MNALPANAMASLLEQIRQRHDDLVRVPSSPARPLRAKSAPAFLNLRSYLQENGVLPEIAEEILALAPENRESRIERDWVERILLERWATESDVECGNQTHIFVGAPGSGKTTVLSKWLAQSVLLDERAARVFRLDGSTSNTAEALSVYGEVLGVKVMRAVADSAALSNELTFVDLPGTGVGNKGALQELRKRCAEFANAKIHVVLNAAYETAHLSRQIEFFTPLAPATLIFSHLDEEARWGKLINFFWKAEVPLSWLSVGQNVPGGLVKAAPGQLLSHQHA